jgi:BCD family chlorophyll transporter-like MFS transporter
LFQLGVSIIGIGRGLFIVGSIATVMQLADNAHTGLFLGMWGVVQALAQGFGTIGGGIARDYIQATTHSVVLGYVGVYLVAGLFLVFMVGYMVIRRIDRRLANGEIRSPWSGLQDIPADQLLY